MVLRQRGETLQTVGARQLHVEEDEICVDLSHERKQVVSVRDLTDQLDVLDSVEDELDRIPHQCVILREDHPDRAHNAANLPLPQTPNGDVVALWVIAARVRPPKGGRFRVG